MTDQLRKHSCRLADGCVASPKARFTSLRPQAIFFSTRLPYKDIVKQFSKDNRLRLPPSLIMPPRLTGDFPCLDKGEFVECVCGHITTKQRHGRACKGGSKETHVIHQSVTIPKLSALGSDVVAKPGVGYLRVDNDFTVYQKRVADTLLLQQLQLQTTSATSANLPISVSPLTSNEPPQTSHISDNSTQQSLSTAPAQTVLAVDRSFQPGLSKLCFCLCSVLYIHINLTTAQVCL
jgi:hypothetical protein